MSFGKKLRELRKQKEMTGQELGNIVEVTRAAVTNWEAGVREPDSKTMIKIADFFNVSLDDLLDREHGAASKKRTVRIKVYGEIPAGIPLEAYEEILGWEEISEDMTKGDKEYVGLRISGDSMLPEYQDGDTIIVLLQEDCENGEHAVVFVDGDNATFKKVIKKDDGSLVLQALNALYEPLVFSKDDVKDLPVRILGIAVESRRKRNGR